MSPPAHTKTVCTFVDGFTDIVRVLDVAGATVYV
jgi:hypothetical protein